MLNTHLGSEFTAAVLTWVAKFEGPKRRGERSSEAPWQEDGLHRCPGTSPTTQRAAVAQEAAHIHSKTGIHTSHPSSSESGAWGFLGEKPPVFTTNIPQRHPSLLQNLKSFFAATILPTGAANCSACCAAFSEKRRKTAPGHRCWADQRRDSPLEEHAWYPSPQTCCTLHRNTPVGSPWSSGQQNDPCLTCFPQGAWLRTRGIPVQGGIFSSKHNPPPHIRY